MSYLPGKFVWFEHLSADPARARNFYQQLFGWHVETMRLGETHYPMIVNGNDGIGTLLDATDTASATAGFAKEDVTDAKKDDDGGFKYGDQAFDRGSYSQTVTPKAGGAAMASKGNYWWFYARNSDGNWQQTRVIWTTE